MNTNSSASMQQPTHSTSAMHALKMQQQQSWNGINPSMDELITTVRKEQLLSTKNLSPRDYKIWQYYVLVLSEDLKQEVRRLAGID